MLQPRSAHAAERAEGGNEIDGFENIGLALGVVAQQQMEAWRKINIQPRVIAEVPKAQMGQMHDLRLRRVESQRRSSPFQIADSFGVVNLVPSRLWTDFARLVLEVGQ